MFSSPKTIKQDLFNEIVIKYIDNKESETYLSLYTKQNGNKINYCRFACCWFCLYRKHPTNNFGEV